MKTMLEAGKEFTPWNEDRARAIIADHEASQHSLLAIFQAMQAVFGLVPNAALPLIAAELNLSRAEVYGFLTFYHDFRLALTGRHVLKLCRAEACQSMGSEKLAEHAADAVGVAFGETTEDGSISLQFVYCLGLCACAPSASLDDQLVGRLDEATLDAFLTEAKS